MDNTSINSNNSKIQENNQNLILVFIYKIPRINHDSMIKLNNQVIDTFKKYGVLRFEVFQLRTYPKIIFLYMIMQQDNCTNPR